MCEPTHSVVQFCRYNANQDPVDHLIGSALRRNLAKCETIGDFLHYSRSGFGHSEALSHTALAASILPDPNRYEGDWWDRKFRHDGYYGDPHKKDEAYELAHEYSKRRALGSIPALQQFLVDALAHSTDPAQYVELVVDKLVRASVRAVVSDLVYSSLAGDKPRSRHRATGAFRQQHPDAWASLLANVTKVAAQRDLLVPEWADDAGIWTPDNQPATAVRVSSTTDVR